MSEKQSLDMTQGKPLPLLVRFSLPLILGSLMIFRNTVQGMGFGISALTSSATEIIGRSAAGLLAVRFNSFFLICVSAPMAWTLACICCIGLCAYYIPKKSKELEYTICRNRRVKL